MAAKAPSPSAHESSPSTIRTQSFLGLPAELRNKIYAHLFLSSDPIRLSFHHDTNSRLSRPMVVPFCLDKRFATALFRTCRQTSVEASSVFYSNNTFLLCTADRKGDDGICFITTLVAFLDHIGPQSRLVRKVLFDKINACTRVCHREYTDWKTPLFSAETDIVEIITLLRIFWSRRLRFEMSVLDSSSSSTEETTCSPCNKAVLSTIQALLNGQLDLNRYGSVVCGVAVKKDGSGGLISWGSTPPRGIHNTAWPRYYPHTTTPFTITSSADSAETPALELVPRTTAHTLFTLPQAIRSHITTLVLFAPGQSVQINVDTTTTFPLGLPHVNKKLYASLWPTSLVAQGYVLRTCTTEACSDFGGFAHLRRVLGKAIVYTTPDGASVPLTLKDGYPGIEQIILEFDLAAGVRFEELRISVLPLVRETGGVCGDAHVVVRMCCGSGVWEKRISLGKLRRDVGDALGGVVVTGVDGREGGWEAQVWISGLGDVVEVVC